MENQLFEVNKKNLSLVYEIVQSFRGQKFFTGTSMFSQLLDNMNLVAEYVFSQEDSCNLKEELEQILPALLQAQSNQDYILQADILEGDLLPLLQKVQIRLQSEDAMTIKDYWEANMQALKRTNIKLYEMFQKKESGSEWLPEEKYQVMLAINGQPIVWVKRGNQTFFMHSSINPETEAKILVDTLPEAKHYIVIGFGVGYHVFELLRRYPECKVTVLERERGFFFLALHYLDWTDSIRMDRLNLVYEPDIALLLKSLEEIQGDYELLVHYPTVQAVEDKQIRMLLEDFFVTTSSMREQSHFLDENFQKIQMQKLPDCSQLKPLFYQKNVVIVGAGPSVNTEIKALKKYRKQLIIFATGHIARTLLKEDVIPDAIIITDPQPHMYNQIKDLNTKEIPLILLSTASASVLKYYQGPVYVAYQKGYHPAELEAEKRSVDMFETGGSVTTTALDIALRFEAKNIIFVGVDLAYTGGNSHAGGVGREITSTDGLRKVVSCNGEEIYTSKNLDIYRKWIERRIVNVTGTVIYNTGNGARIQGTKKMVWEELANFI